MQQQTETALEENIKKIPLFVAFRPVTFCPVTFCPVAFCPDTDNRVRSKTFTGFPPRSWRSVVYKQLWYILGSTE